MALKSCPPSRIRKQHSTAAVIVTEAAKQSRFGHRKNCQSDKTLSITSHSIPYASESPPEGSTKPAHNISGESPSYSVKAAKNPRSCTLIDVSAVNNASKKRRPLESREHASKRCLRESTIMADRPLPLAYNVF